MGFRQGAALASVCFCLGVLFISFNADYRVLYQPMTDKTIDDAVQFYTTFHNAPKAVLVRQICPLSHCTAADSPERTLVDLRNDTCLNH
ncbi:hypothetical protein FRC16_010621 [Serendipita sp. 398]|nr:hypothetical protein FRC16_010621 [Serendipita sp. 398]